jgi:phospholipid:diacylglycerol acyltransferase
MTSDLRRRVVGAEPRSNSTLSASQTYRDQSPVKSGDKVKIVHHHDEAPTRKRRSTFIFLLGSVFGLIAAGLLAQSNDLIEFPELRELSVDSLLDVLPAGLVTDMKDLVVRFKSPIPPQPRLTIDGWPEGEERFFC